MTTTDTVLRRALEGGGDERRLTLDPAFQGLPDTAHGGSVLGLFEAIAERHTARALTGHYRKRVPLATPLRLRVAREGETTALRLLEGDAVLVDGRVGPAAATPVAVAAAPAPSALPLPVSAACFACGVDNPLGLQLRLRADDATVGAAWTPRDTLRTLDGTVAPVALTTLLDEAAFWLGALATGESGMTTELRVVLHRPAPAGEALTVTGARAAVRARAGDARYWDTAVVARDASGHVVADATITFVAIRGAARRLVQGMLRINPPDIVRRVFPAYAADA